MVLVKGWCQSIALARLRRCWFGCAQCFFPVVFLRADTTNRLYPALVVKDKDMVCSMKSCSPFDNALV